MLQVLNRMLLVLGGMAAAALLGLWVGGPLAAALAALAVALLVVGRDTLSLLQVVRWLKAPEVASAPSVSGDWAEIVYRFSRNLRLWQSRLQHEQNKLSRFIEALQVSPNGVLLLDANNQIDWCNATAARHFGLDPARDLRQHAVHLIRNPEFVAYLQAQRFSTPLQMQRSGPRGQVLTLNVQVFPYGDQQKLLLSQDITQFERTEAMRRDFVANVSHEIKTPLTVLAGFVETLRETPLEPEQREQVLAMMQAQSDRMRHLIEDLLVLARLEGDAFPPADEVVPMPPLLEQLLAEARGLSGERHTVRLHIRCRSNLRGAAGELHSAMSNLVSNAVRYTPEGGQIDIAWDDAVDDRGLPTAEFSVTDTGIGIAAEHIPRLTERFYRVDRGRSRGAGGTGLGLAIVKHVLLRHQAELLVHSTPGKGSRFVVRFPASRLVPAGSRDEAAGEAALASAAEHGRS